MGKRIGKKTDISGVGHSDRPTDEHTDGSSDRPADRNRQSDKADRLLDFPPSNFPDVGRRKR